MAIRITSLEDSGLIARKLGPFRLDVCATPDFVRRHGPIDHPGALSGIPCIVDTNSRTLNNWRFEDPSDGSRFTVSVKGRMEVNSPIASMRAAAAGLGAAVVPDFVARERIASGELVSILGEFTPRDRGIYAIYPHRRYLPAKVRAFVDYLSEWFRKNA